MAAMTVMVTKGNRGASDLTSATNVCQLKVEELKDVDWDALGNWPGLVNEEGAYRAGLPLGAMLQEGSFERVDVAGNPEPGGLNSQGKTYAEVYAELDATLDEPVLTEQTRQRGPYNIVRSFAICNGTDYNPGTGNHTTAASFVDPGGDLSPAALDCDVDPEDSSTRVEELACKSEDIAMTKGPGSTEKMIKVLCAWRDRGGQCHSVKLDTTVVDLGS